MKIHTTRDINASAAAIWDLLAERFADIGLWAGAVTKSDLDREMAVGAIRTCHLKSFGPAGGVITERVTVFERDRLRLTYVIESGMPGFMRFVENAWAIEPLGPTRARVSSDARFDIAWYMLPMSPMMRMQMVKGLRTFMDEMEAETTQAPLKAAA